MIENIRGVKLAYEISGSGNTPPLVLLHAFPVDRRMWKQVAPALATNRRVLTFDFRGFGESALGSGGHSIADFAEDTAALLDKLGIETAVLGGLSMGGYAALAFAQMFPNRLAGLILADTRAEADSPEVRRTRDQGITAVSTDGVMPFVEKLVPRLLSPHVNPSVLEEVQTLAKGQSLDAIQSALMALRDRPDRTGELHQIRCPTLVMVGSEDGVTPPEDAKKLAAAIPGAAYVLIKGAGHLCQFESPASFIRAVDNFLESLESIR